MTNRKEQIGRILDNLYNELEKASGQAGCESYSIDNSTNSKKNIISTTYRNPLEIIAAIEKLESKQGTLGA